MELYRSIIEGLKTWKKRPDRKPLILKGARQTGKTWILEYSAFKIYLADIGLLRELAGLPPEVIISGNTTYTEFKGALAENYILQSLVYQLEILPRYWTSVGKAEVDFVIQLDVDIIPIEVKSDTRFGGGQKSVGL